MFLTEARWLAILNGKWLRIFIVIGSLNCIIATLFYFQLCNTNWLEMIKGFFCNQFAMACAVSGGTISFGLTLDHPVLKKMIVRMVYRTRINMAIKTLLPPLILKIQEKRQIDQAFLSWRNEQEFKMMLRKTFQPSLGIRQLAKTPAINGKIEEVVKIRKAA